MTKKYDLLLNLYSGEILETEAEILTVNKTELMAMLKKYDLRIIEDNLIDSENYIFAEIDTYSFINNYKQTNPDFKPLIRKQA